jgi:hypothetical protein
MQIKTFLALRRGACDRLEDTRWCYSIGTMRTVPTLQITEFRVRKQNK